MKLQWIQALRAIAASLVLIAHLGQEEADAFAAGLAPAWTLAGVSGVDLFFVISGFVMVYVTRGTTHGAPAIAGRFLYSRAARIYPPYWLFTALAIAGYFIFDGLSRSLGELDLVRDILLIPGEEPPVLLVGWTLIHEMYFYIVFTGLLLLPRRFLPALVTVWNIAPPPTFELCGIASPSHGVAVSLWADEQKMPTTRLTNRADPAMMVVATILTFAHNRERSATHAPPGGLPPSLSWIDGISFRLPHPGLPTGQRYDGRDRHRSAR